jgi:MFS transporter, SHS family, lactate transporter
MTPWWREPTRDQWASFLAAWSGWVLDAFDFTIFLLVIPSIAREFGASTTAVTSSITLTLLVRLLGGLAAGALADRIGRRAVLMASIVWFAACDAMVAFAPSLAWVIVLRLFFGFGMGAEWTGGTTLAMENWPERSRGIASGILQGSWAIGYLLAAIVSARVLPLFGWRGLFLLAAIPALLVIPIRIFVKESREFRRALEERTTSGWREVFEPENLKKLLFASFAMSFGFAGYYAFSALYPAMLETELGMSSTAISDHVALFNAGMLVGSIAFGIVAKKHGVGPAVIAPALASLFFIPLYVGVSLELAWLGALAIGAIGVGWCGTVPILLTGLFPAHIRARCVGATYHAGAFVAAFVPTAVAWFHEFGGLTLAWSIAVFAGASELLLTALFLFRALKERSYAAQLARSAALLSVLLLCGCSDRDCTFGHECPSGQCRLGACVAVTEGPQDAAIALQPDAMVELELEDAGFQHDAEATTCVPDGRLEREDLPLAPGIGAPFAIASNATASMAGMVEAGRRIWDLSGPRPQDRIGSVEFTPIDARALELFPDATFSAPMTGVPATLGLFAATSDGLFLLGAVSTMDGPLRTELRYDPPLRILTFPMTVGSTWTTTSTITGMLGGAPARYAEMYRAEVDAEGTLRAPAGDFSVLRIRGELVRTVRFATSRVRSFSFVAECVGTVAWAISFLGEPQIEFELAAELGRIAR